MPPGYICATATERPQSWGTNDRGLSPGHLVPSRGWGGGIDGTCKTYAIRFAWRQKSPAF